MSDHRHPGCVWCMTATNSIRRASGDDEAVMACTLHDPFWGRAASSPVEGDRQP